MKLTLRYGLIITAGVAAWTIIAHTLVPNPQSNIHSFGAMTFFNLLHFAGIYLGIKALEREQGRKPTFKEAFKQGISIALVYAIGCALFFVVVLLVIGTRWMASEPMPGAPLWVKVAGSFVGLVVFTLFFGIIYSALIAFVLARRLANET